MARFPLKDEDKRLWSLVAATVRPHTSKAKLKATTTPTPESENVTLPETVTLKGLPPDKSTMTAAPLPPLPLAPFHIGQALKPQSGFKLYSDSPKAEPYPIEPKRKRRLSRERDPIEARLDLHGLTQIQAESRLKAFVQQAYASDYRAILVITGKGLAENGILKRHAPEWLADPALSPMIAGVSQAHARHGGSGALYIALKRRP